MDPTCSKIIIYVSYILFVFPFQMVDKLREHLNRHLPRLGKKKIDLLVVNYAAKLVCFCSNIIMAQFSFSTFVSNRPLLIFSIDIKAVLHLTVVGKNT